MDRGVSRIPGLFRDPGRREEERVTYSQQNLPGLVVGPSQLGSQIDRDIERYMQRDAERRAAATRSVNPEQAPPQMRLDLRAEESPTPVSGVMVDRGGRPIFSGGQEFLSVANLASMSPEDRRTGRTFGTQEQTISRRSDDYSPKPQPRRRERFSPANTPEKMASKIEARGAETSEEKALALVQEFKEYAGADDREFLDSYAQDLTDNINATAREAAKRRDPSTAQTGTPGFVGEDLTNERYERGGFDTRTLRTPGPRSMAVARRDPDRENLRAEAGVLSEELGGDQVPPYMMEVRNRGRRGQLDGSVTRIDPNSVGKTALDVLEDQDKTAAFLRTTEVTMADRAKDLREQERTPAMSSSGLNAAMQQGRARRFTQQELDARLAQDENFTGVGLYRKSADKPAEVIYPVMRDGMPVTTTRTVPDGMFGSREVEEPLYRIGEPQARTFDDSREMVRNALGPTRRNPKLADRDKQIGPAVLIESPGYRINYEKKGAESQFDFFGELANAGSVMPRDVRSDMRDLAEASITGQMPVVVRPQRGAAPERTTKPMRGSVASLYSNINPKTPRNPAGQDSPVDTAGKQLRAFLQEAAEIRPVNRAELAEAAQIIGNRFGVSASDAISASVTADPGRPLFAPGSFAEKMLMQARAEQSGQYRPVDLFDESDIGAGMERIAEDIRLDEEMYQGGPVDDGRDINMDDLDGQYNEAAGGMSKGGYSVFNPMERPGGTVIEGLSETSQQLEQLVGRDVMESYVDYAKQFIPDIPGQEGNREAQARMVVEQALLDNPEIVAPDSLRRSNQSQLAIAEAISNQLNRPVATSVDPALNTTRAQRAIAEREQRAMQVANQLAEQARAHARPQASVINTSGYSALNAPAPQRRI